MKKKRILYMLSLCIAAGVHIPAQAITKKKTKNYLKLIEAYKKPIPAGEEVSPPMTGTHFIIIWQGDKYPETFFWRGESGWLSCNMLKVHKLPGKSKTLRYKTVDVTGDDIHMGDTLELSPVTGGRYPIPTEIPVKAKNTLFFKTGASNWLSFPVKKINKRY